MRKIIITTFSLLLFLLFACASSINYDLNKVNYQLNYKQEEKLIDNFNLKDLNFNYDKNKYNHEISNLLVQNDKITFDFILINKKDNTKSKVKKFIILNFLTKNKIKQKLSDIINKTEISYDKINEISVVDFNINDLKLKIENKDNLNIKKELIKKNSKSVELKISINFLNYPNIFAEKNFILENFKEPSAEQSLMLVIENLKYKENNLLFEDLTKDNIEFVNYDNKKIKIENLSLIKGLFTLKVKLRATDLLNNITAEKEIFVKEENFNFRNNKILGKKYDDSVKISNLSFILDTLNININKNLFPSDICDKLKQKYDLDGDTFFLKVISFDDLKGEIKAIVKLDKADSFDEEITINGFEGVSEGTNKNSVKEDEINIKLLDERTLLDLNNKDINTNKYIDFEKIDEKNFIKLLNIPQEFTLNNNNKINLNDLNLNFHITRLDKNKSTREITFSLSITKKVYKSKTNSSNEKELIEERTLYQILKRKVKYLNHQMILNILIEEVNFLPEPKTNTPSLFEYKKAIDSTLLRNFYTYQQEQEHFYSEKYFNNNRPIIETEHVQANDFEGKLYYSIYFRLENHEGVTIAKSTTVQKEEAGFIKIKKEFFENTTLEREQLESEELKKSFSHLINNFKNEQDQEVEKEYDHKFIKGNHILKNKIINFVNDQNIFDFDKDELSDLKKNKYTIRIDGQELEYDKSSTSGILLLISNHAPFYIIPAKIHITPKKVLIKLKGEKYQIRIIYEIKFEFKKSTGISDVSSTDFITIENSEFNVEVHKNLFN